MTAVPVCSCTERSAPDLDRSCHLVLGPPRDSRVGSFWFEPTWDTSRPDPTSSARANGHDYL